MLLVITTTSSANRNKKVVERFGFADHGIRILVDFISQFFTRGVMVGGHGEPWPPLLSKFEFFSEN